MTKNIIVILGPTAVGKSDFAISLAQELNGEIISADSMQVYKELNIGTAKASIEEKKNIQHHLMDIKNFNETYNAFNFVNDCTKKIDEILLKDKTPIIVGGTNLYITALINNYNFEKTNLNEEKYKSKYTLNFIVYALNIKPRSKLYDRINKRVDTMLKKGLIEEVRTLKSKGLTTESQAGKSIGYRELLQYFDGFYTREEAIDKIKQHSRNFAKRQLTWLRSMKTITWLNAEEPSLNLQKVINEYKKL